MYDNLPFTGGYVSDYFLMSDFLLVSVGCLATDPGEEIVWHINALSYNLSIRGLS